MSVTAHGIYDRAQVDYHNWMYCHAVMCFSNDYVFFIEVYNPLVIVTLSIGNYSCTNPSYDNPIIEPRPNTFQRSLRRKCSRF